MSRDAGLARSQGRDEAAGEVSRSHSRHAQVGHTDRIGSVIQQAIHQTLSPIWEPVFSAHSYGFRPGRSARQAIKAAQRQVRSGKRWVVDVDVEKFFDRVNPAALMARVARRVKDERMPGLIRRYLESGIMLGGLVEQRVEGTPQPAFPPIRLKAQVLPKAPVFGRSRSVSFLYFVS